MLTKYQIFGRSASIATFHICLTIRLIRFLIPISATRWLGWFFYYLVIYKNENLPKSINLLPSKVKILPKIALTNSQWLWTFCPNNQNFAKSGHTYPHLLMSSILAQLLKLISCSHDVLSVQLLCLHPGRIRIFCCGNSIGWSIRPQSGVCRGVGIGHLFRDVKLKCFSF